MGSVSQRHALFGHKTRGLLSCPGLRKTPGLNLLLLPPIRILPNPTFIGVFALWSSLMLSSFSHKAGVYMHVWECLLWPALPCFPSCRHWCGGRVRRSVRQGRRTHSNRGVPGKERIQFSSVFRRFRRCRCSVHVCVWSCKQALLMKWGWSRESCSHFKHHLFITPLCARLTRRHKHMRWQKFCSLFHHAPAINLIPFPPPLSFLSSLKINGVFCHPKLCFVQYSSKVGEGEGALISYSMNFHKLHKALIGKWRTSCLTHINTRMLTHTKNPIIKASGEALFGTARIWQWFMEKGSHTAPWYTQKL